MSNSIAIDYDNTFDRDPMFFRELAELGKKHGYMVWMVTRRYRSDFTDEEFEELLELTGLPKHRHIFTNHAAKKWFCEQRGIQVAFWIDDDPASILQPV